MHVIIPTNNQEELPRNINFTIFTKRQINKLATCIISVDSPNRVSVLQLLEFDWLDFLMGSGEELEMVAKQYTSPLS